MPSETHEHTYLSLEILYNKMHDNVEIIFANVGLKCLKNFHISKVSLWRGPIE